MLKSLERTAKEIAQEMAFEDVLNQMTINGEELTSTDELEEAFYSAQNLPEVEVEQRAEIVMIEVSRDENHIVLEVPGYGKEDIEAYFQDDLLIVEGSAQPIYEGEGIEYKEAEFYVPTSFKNKFQLGKYTEVDTIKVKNGLCTITLFEREPEKQMLKVA